MPVLVLVFVLLFVCLPLAVMVFAVGSGVRSYRRARRGGGPGADLPLGMHLFAAGQTAQVVGAVIFFSSVVLIGVGFVTYMYATGRMTPEYRRAEAEAGRLAKNEDRCLTFGKFAVEKDLKDRCVEDLNPSRKAKYKFLRRDSSSGPDAQRDAQKPAQRLAEVPTTAPALARPATQEAPNGEKGLLRVPGPLGRTDRSSGSGRGD